MIIRRLNHFGETDVWGVIVISIFGAVLLCTAYLFWWHGRAFASIPNTEDEEENEDL